MFTDKIKFFIWLLCIAAITVVLSKVPSNLGLDLQGGMRLVLEAKDTKQVKVDETAMQGVVTVIRNRIDGLGVSEPLIAVKGRRQVVVELPGIKDPSRAIKLIGDTALMEFIEAEWLPGNGTNISTADLKVLGGENARVEKYVVKDAKGNIEKEMPIILKTQVMTGSDLKRADPGVDQYGRPIVSIEFTAKGTDKFAEVTRRNVGKPLAILLDGKIISAPNISEPILGGKAQISGSFSPTDVQDLVIKLKAGSLPVPVQIVAKEEVGPSLGLESIHKSIIAGIIGFVLIAIFMIGIYRYLGLMAIVALLFYAALNLAALNVLHVTLTLPGIAGILLGLGMAVDANVLIFERYKEELRNGNTVLNALDAGFNRAMITIIDSNVTTLLTAGTLFWFGTGTIKGFAVTLSVGIVLSMLTSLVLSKYLLSASLTIRRIRESRWVEL